MIFGGLEHENKFKTFLPSINTSLEGGLGAKELAMVVAPPGVGKSLFLVNQGVHSMMEGRKVLYVSMEMSEDKIAQRFDSIMTLIPQGKLKDVSTQLSVLFIHSTSSWVKVLVCMYAPASYYELVRARSY